MSVKKAVRSEFRELDSPLQSEDLLLTGFPGFISAQLLRRLIPMSDENQTFFFLIESSRRSQAKRWLESLASDFPAFQGSYKMVEGDITEPRLGLDVDTYDRFTERIGVVWHLAALYDLGVPEQIGYQVNVEGTQRVIDFCLDCESLERFNYISTCYVSGDRTERIYEDELDEGQSHRNYYESTKFWAEVEVQKHFEDIPTTVFRPSMVVGDSQTGETHKYDGPYYIFKLLHKLPDWLPVMHFGEGSTEANITPVDFVSDAMAYIGTATGNDGRVFQLADPDPLQAREVMDLVIECMGRAKALGTMPGAVAETVFKSDLLQRWTGIPKEAIVYFNEAGHFDTSYTDQALSETSIESPHISSYMQTLVDYFLKHPDGPPHPV